MIAPFDEARRYLNSHREGRLRPLDLETKTNRLQNKKFTIIHHRIDELLGLGGYLLGTIPNNKMAIERRNHYGVPSRCPQLTLAPQGVYVEPYPCLIMVCYLKPADQSTVLTMIFMVSTLFRNATTNMQRSHGKDVNQLKPTTLHDVIFHLSTIIDNPLFSVVIKYLHFPFILGCSLSQLRKQILFPQMHLRVGHPSRPDLEMLPSDRASQIASNEEVLCTAFRGGCFH